MDESYSPHQLVYLNGHSPPDDSMHWITLGELEREDDPNVDALSGVLLLRVIKYKVNDKDPKDGNIIYKNQKHNSSSYNNYDRMIAVMDANSPPGENLAWILCASNRNDGIFNNYTKERDYFLFTPGAYLAIESPAYVTSFMGTDDNSVPILECPKGVFVVDQRNISLPMRQISDTNTRLHAVYYPYVELALKEFVIIDGNCFGGLCGNVHAYEQNKMKKSCACITTTQRLSKLILMFSFAVKMYKASGGEILIDEIVYHFTSRDFTNLFLKSPIPFNTRAAVVNSNTKFVRNAGRTIQKAFKHVNENGGFNLLGYVRKGRKKDEGANDSTALSGDTKLNPVYICLNEGVELLDDHRLDFNGIDNDEKHNHTVKLKRSADTAGLGEKTND